MNSPLNWHELFRNLPVLALGTATVVAGGAGVMGFAAPEDSKVSMEARTIVPEPSPPVTAGPAAVSDDDADLFADALVEAGAGERDSAREDDASEPRGRVLSVVSTGGERGGDEEPSSEGLDLEDILPPDSLLLGGVDAAEELRAFREDLVRRTAAFPRADGTQGDGALRFVEGPTEVGGDPGPSRPSPAAIARVKPQRTPKQAPVAKPEPTPVPPPPVVKEAIEPVIVKDALGGLGLPGEQPNPATLTQAIAEPSLESEAQRALFAPRESPRPYYVVDAPLTSPTPVAAAADVRAQLGNAAMPATPQVSPQQAAIEVIQQVQEQVEAIVARLRWRQEERVRLRVKAGGAGEVTVGLRIKRARVHVQLDAEETGLGDALQAARPELDRRLGRRGYHLESYDVIAGDRETLWTSRPSGRKERSKVWNLAESPAGNE